MTKPYTNAEGYLDVGDGHEIFWEDWGNADAKTPIIHLHGGPGSGYNDKHKAIYDPQTHRVIFYDQRGAGRSKPLGEIEHNTTPDLVEDINRLRDHLDIEQPAYVAGGSWGSTLALNYAIAHPDNVAKLMIWGVYLGTVAEDKYINEGYARPWFTQEWQRFIARVPETHRRTGNDTMQYYAERIHGDDPEIAQEFADEWNLWESSLLSIEYDPQTTEADVKEDPADSLAGAKIETHYFMNGCFMDEDYILNNVDKIKHISCLAIQGRFDMCTPPATAYELARKYGQKMVLTVVNGGHRRNDPAILAALQQTARTELT